MQKLLALIKQAGPAPDLARWNLCREYLQARMLQSVFATPAGRSLTFQGGTCLRICHQLGRYSEDLDFSLERGGRTDTRAGRVSARAVSLAQIHSSVLRDLARRGFEVDGKVQDEKVVQKAWVRVGGLPGRVGLSYPANQKLSIKIEIDTRPPDRGVREMHFVSRMDIDFHVLKHDLATLFAGKLLALFHRPYERGRDYYDLLWFLGRRIEGNVAYLNAGMAQSFDSAQDKAGKGDAPFKTWREALRAVAPKAEKVDGARLAEDLERFLEDPSERTRLRNYPEAFRQLFRDLP